MASSVSARVRPRSANPLTSVTLLVLINVMASVLVLMGSSWDDAYHRRYVVDTFFSPPHLMIYGGMVGTILGGLMALGLLLIGPRNGEGFIATLARRPLLVLPVIANLGFLATGPFDDLWHRMFGRDGLTSWTVPHAILIMNMVTTMLAVIALELWLRTALRSESKFAPPLFANRWVGVALLLSLTMLPGYLWLFVGEWEGGSTAGNPFFHIGAIYPPLATLIITISLTLMRRVAGLRWWALPPMMTMAFMWRALPGIFLILAGYKLTSAVPAQPVVLGLVYGLIEWRLADRSDRVRSLVFGVIAAGLMVVFWALHMLPTLSLIEAAAPAPLVVAAAVLGGKIGTWLAALLQRAAAAHARMTLAQSE